MLSALTKRPWIGSARRAILLTLGSCLISACAHMSGCKASASIPIFGFDILNQRIYSGKKEDPALTVEFSDASLERNYVAMRLDDWRMVLDRLATCK